MSTIIVIDDDAEVLEKMANEIRDVLPDAEGTVTQWQPSGDNVLNQLEEIRQHAVLLVTDLDLSKTRTGLRGDSIIRWCQRHTLPAALYTRGNQAELPAVPDLFELKIPSNQSRARYIAELYRGFSSISDAVLPLIPEGAARGPASVLAQILDKPNLEHEFAQYARHIGEASGALTSRVKRTGPIGANPHAPEQEEVRHVVAYVLGHLLVNAVLRYPGPLLPVSALCGYIGTNEEESDALSELFSNARYTGPFEGLDRIFWREEVDGQLDRMLDDGTAYEEYSLRRSAVERRLGRELGRHACPRCAGVNGGFYCPFTNRAVCERGDCSTASNSWLPLGATACRIELDFFDEWAPLLGF